MEHPTPLCIKIATRQGWIEVPTRSVFDASYPNSINRRGRLQGHGKISPALTSAGAQNLWFYEDSNIPPPKLLGFSRDCKGRISKYHLKDFANALSCHSCSGNTTTLYIISSHNMQNDNKYRIRKLTPRECFRLMDVDDDRIDLIQTAGISKSQQYKLAGNSIVVACLYHIFHNLFIDTSHNHPIQSSLFDL